MLTALLLLATLLVLSIAIAEVGSQASLGTQSGAANTGGNSVYKSTNRAGQGCDPKAKPIKCGANEFCEDKNTCKQKKEACLKYGPNCERDIAQQQRKLNKCKKNKDDCQRGREYQDEGTLTKALDNTKDYCKNEQSKMKKSCDTPEYKNCKKKVSNGSFFADNWLDNEAESDINTETLQQQYQYLKDHHTYGDLNVAKTKVAEFLGLKLKNADRFVPHLGSNTDAVNKYDVSIDLLQRRIASAQDINEKNSLIVKLEGLYAGRQYVDKHMTEYVNSIQHLLTVDSNAILNTKQELNNEECYRKLSICYHICYKWRPNIAVSLINSFSIGTKLVGRQQLCSQPVECTNHIHSQCSDPYVDPK
ncbi:unnamed protein product [Medioppia subpectinata]|uniref:Uncharacterized protein n=1 Tax=Medioppia subpectinata TaxID=1979941 RepID=A0A7R9KCA9_9ACAR|nr:unnamed protein product [Medioppia subpectinata]CAG2100474.1 unnamed protein product [Medioppia subpectinata]